MSQISVVARSLWKADVEDPHIWTCVARRIVAGADASPRDLSLTLFSLSCVMQKDPTLLSNEIKGLLSSHLEMLASDPSFFSRVTLIDISQLVYAVSILFPQSSVVTPYISKSTALLNALPRSTEELPILNSCREICVLWSVARLRKDIKNRTSRDFNEALIEASRGLRNCADFNQNKAAQLADNLRTLSLTDSRIMFQLIHFLDKYGGTLNAKNYMRIVSCMGELKVDNPTVWRRLAKRIESPLGVSLSIAQLELLRKYIVKLSPPGVAQRATGIISLYIKTKLDAAMYGDSNPS